MYYAPMVSPPPCLWLFILAVFRTHQILNELKTTYRPAHSFKLLILSYFILKWDRLLEILHLNFLRRFSAFLADW